MAAATEDPGYLRSEHKEALLNRLKRISGQVGGVQRMVEEDRYCARGADRGDDGRGRPPAAQPLSDLLLRPVSRRPLRSSGG